MRFFECRERKTEEEEEEEDGVREEGKGRSAIFRRRSNNASCELFPLILHKHIHKKLPPPSVFIFPRFIRPPPPFPFPSSPSLFDVNKP